MDTSHSSTSDVGAGPSVRFKDTGSFGARACRSMRTKILDHGWSALPVSWRRKWMVQRILATPPWNLAVESAALNFSKGNAWCEGHGDLFSTPEQLRLI